MPPETKARPPAAGDAAQELLAEFTTLLRRSGQDVLVAGVVLVFVLAGVALQAGAVRDLDAPLVLARLPLLMALGLGLLRCAALLTLTHGRLLHPISLIRRATNAPARSGWRPYLAVRSAPHGGVTFEHVQLLIADAHDRRYFAHAALCWSYGCAGGFVLWTVLNAIAGAG
jgi:hypothetical protein